MNEAFLQYIWAHRLYKSASLLTSTGKVVEILNPGRHNTDAGPDFFNAQLRIDGMTWAGNVEIHISSDDWYRHGHDSDPAYNNVILHVVANSTGREIRSAKGDTIPEATLLFDDKLSQRYDHLVRSGDLSFVRCADSLPLVSSVQRTAWLDALLVERMGQKSAKATEFFQLFNGDMDQAFFCLLARALGSKVNAEPMELLARQTPLKVLLKHNNPMQTEAILLGQSGLLSQSPSDDYVRTLQREYSFLKEKFNLDPIPPTAWKYARMRPQNFPDIRIVQLAAIIRALPGNFQSALFLPLDKILAVRPSDYWDSHFRLGVSSPQPRSKQLGSSTRRLVMINCVIPFAIAEANRYANESKKDAAFELLRAIPMESNAIIEGWERAGVSPQNEADAQALIHLKKNYCDKNDCLRCRFGHCAISHGFSPVPYSPIP